MSQEPLPLFRPETINRRVSKLEGRIVLPIGAINRIGTMVILLMSGLIVTLAVLIPFPKRKSLTGWLVPDNGIVRIAIPVGGTLERLDVQEGQRVAKGQRLATIRIAPNIVDGNYQTIQSGQFSRQGDALGSESRARLMKLDVEAEEIGRTLKTIPVEIAEGDQRLRIKLAARDLAKENLDRMQEAASAGYLSKRDLATLQAALLTAESDASDARANLLSLRRQLDQTSARLRAIPLEKTAELAARERSSAQLAGQLADQKVRTEYEITSPAEGAIAVIPAEFGRFLPAGTTLSVILLGAAEQHVHAELFAPTETAALLKQGQTVRLVFGTAGVGSSSEDIGTITAVSLVPLVTDEIPQRALGSPSSMYRVRVELSKQTAWIQHHDVHLLPGMQVGADVTVELATLLQDLAASIAPGGK
jgi:membrane fusion protein